MNQHLVKQRKTTNWLMNQMTSNLCIRLLGYLKTLPGLSLSISWMNTHWILLILQAQRKLNLIISAEDTIPQIQTIPSSWQDFMLVGIFHQPWWEFLWIALKQNVLPQYPVATWKWLLQSNHCKYMYKTWNKFVFFF